MEAGTGIVTFPWWLANKAPTVKGMATWLSGPGENWNIFNLKRVYLCQQNAHWSESERHSWKDANISRDTAHEQTILRGVRIHEKELRNYINKKDHAARYTKENCQVTLVNKNIVTAIVMKEVTIVTSQ
jgi:hypothetical protein